MASIKIADLPTGPPADLTKEEVEKEVKKRTERIAKLHQQMVAENKNSLLIVLQGMDGSGKDGATRNVFGQCAPYGVRTHSFKKPTDEEFGHDFLWRVHKQAPLKGEIMIFNRSHYEDILIQRVHGWISEERVQKRMAAINAFEELMQFDNNTIVLKFFLHISKDQQLLELQQRLDDPKKHWKHNAGDWKEREYWDQYMRCYEDVLNWSTIPWHVVPVDKRWYRDYLITDIVLQAMEGLNMQYPPLKE
ncbi:MAG: polyphosphate kinase [Bacteroidetes bacterium]|nr:MAG: polyphosphate kinase [Bacteroidota bacterium]PTM11371.1 MAG: polyphosphate kinase [Bacteroidota bacterium]